VEPDATDKHATSATESGAKLAFIR
jgi:hypothetical protein